MVNDGVVNARKACVFRAHFAEFSAFWVEFHDSRIPLNIFAGLILTMKRCIPPSGAARLGKLYWCIINDLCIY